MVDGIPDFLRISSEERAAAWRVNPPKAVSHGYEQTETERLYRESIERDRAVKRELDRQRFTAMRTKAAVVKMETDLIKAAARIAKWKD